MLYHIYLFNLLCVKYSGQPGEGSGEERRPVLCWELSHLGRTPLPPAGRLDFHPEPQGGTLTRIRSDQSFLLPKCILVSGRHSQACEPRRENQEGSKHQEVAGGQTVHRVLERKNIWIHFLSFFLIKRNTTLLQSYKKFGVSHSTS